MADGVTTRVQKEVGFLHKELEAVRSEFSAANEQLRKDMEARFEAASLESRQMFAQIMLKFDTSPVGGTEGSGSIGSSEMRQKGMLGVTGEIKGVTPTVTENLDLTGGARMLTKYSKLECPRFDGEDFRGWLLKIQQFFEADQTRESEKLRHVMMNLEGKALQ